MNGISVDKKCLMECENYQDFDVNEICYAMIHPAIGVARVGNSVTEYYIGPEFENAPPPEYGSTRDKTGAIKRQAAKFRVYGYNKLGYAIKELTSHNAEIEWEVEVANTKSSWYEFNSAMDQSKAIPVKRRNPDILGQERQSLEITPSNKKISGINKGNIYLDDGKFKSVNVNLGELKTDSKGRLLFLGGHGVAASPSKAPLLIFDEHGNEHNFNNSIDWYDDICDGPIRASVTMNGKSIPVTSAWVVVAPPDYAPGIRPFRSMLDLIKHSSIDSGVIEDDKETSYTKHILPLLLKLHEHQWLNVGFAKVFGHKGSKPITNKLIKDLVKKENHLQRFEIYSKFRSPEDRSARGGEDLKWPQLYGDGFEVKKPQEKDDLLAVPHHMYKHLVKFVQGKFINDLDHQKYPDDTVFPEQVYSVPLNEIPVINQPKILDQGPLSYCLADAFHPGCELTWPMRHATLYDGYLRIKEGKNKVEDYGDVLTPDKALADDGPLNQQKAGDLTRWMAVPWQGDTARCRSGYDTEFHPYLPSFWPARVPNEVLSEENYALFSDQTLDDRVREDSFVQREHWLRKFMLENPENEAVMLSVVSRFDELGILHSQPAPQDRKNLFSHVYVEQLKPNSSLIPSYAAFLGGRIDGKEVANREGLLKQAGWTEEQLKSLKQKR